MKEEESEKYDYLKWFGYAWNVIINLISVFVVLAIYNKVYEDFETIVVSLLVLIYLSIQGFLIAYSKTTTDVAFALDTEFKQIRKLLNNEPDEYEKEDLQEAKKKVGKANVKMYINAAFLSIIYLIALVYLFGAL